MSITHGDILEVTFNHPVIGSGVLSPKSAEESQYDLGGFRSEDDSNGITGNGKMIDKMVNTRWMFEMPVAWDNTEETLEKLVSLAASPIPADWTISSINGSVYSGTGKPVGDIVGNGANGTIQVKVSGGGKLKKI